MEWGPQILDGLMVWGTISNKRAIGLEGVVGTMDAEYCTTILCEGLLRAANGAMGELWILQQNNAPIYTSEHARCWLKKDNFHVLNWPAHLPDLDIIKIVWGYVAMDIYKNGRRYESKEQLRDAVFDSFMNISVDIIKSLYHSIPLHIISVIERRGAIIDYYCTEECFSVVLVQRKFWHVYRISSVIYCAGGMN